MKQPLVWFTLTVVILALLTPQEVLGGKKKKKKTKTNSATASAAGMFDTKTLKCLVCKSVIEEFEAAIYKIDPKKMIDTGTFRVNEKGEQKRTVIPFARSQIHLLELTENVCQNFEDYAQATFKSNGKPTIIRLTTPEGNMNPNFGKVDIVPDEDLNAKLKFHCESIVEDQDEALLDLLADESLSGTLTQEICVERGEYCKTIKDEL